MFLNAILGHVLGTSICLTSTLANSCKATPMNNRKCMTVLSKCLYQKVDPPPEGMYLINSGLHIGMCLK